MNERITRPMSVPEMMREIAAQAREAGCTCEWWTPPNGPNAGLPQRQLNRRNDCPVEGHNTFLAGEAT